MPTSIIGEGFKILYASMAAAEDLYLYHLCPGGAVLRLVIPGSPWRCRVCRWSSIVDADPLEQRVLTERELAARLPLLSPEILLLDGPEPLAQLRDKGLGLPTLAMKSWRSVKYVAFSTMGFISREVIEEAYAAGFRAVVFEYTPPYEIPPGFDRVVERLRRIYDVFPILEIITYYDGDKRAKTTISSLAAEYPEAALHIVALNGASDAAYSLAEKLREKHLNVYPHPEESYTLLNTTCTSCGRVLVERRPWGVKVNVKGEGLVVCPYCGAQQRLIVCNTRRVRSMHREVIVW
ncbi:MAG: hypothetical protein DSY37_03040 [Hyperthermus sp.]|nr:MAG: hypothetical protein DSY37_03040 [Hyperthermus sp.]